MRKVEDSIQINAPVDLVWQVTLDVVNWPTWTPTVTRADRLDDGPFGLGSQTRLEQPGLPPAVWTVTAVEPYRRFAWRASVRGMHMTGIHQMEPRGDHATMSVLTLQMEGWFGQLLWPWIASRIGASLQQENAGLKRHCEHLRAESPRPLH
ncbi:MAG: SRPBCC family protein [Pirellulales bacterium]